MSIHQETTGIILAGGKSSRMGFEKGLAEIQGKKMIEWVIAALQPLCKHMLIVSNSEVYRSLELAVYPDTYKEIGPLGGVYTGLGHSTTPDNLVLACDMPFISTSVLQGLLQESPGYEIVVPSVQNQWQPMCAYYNRQIIRKLEELIHQKTWKMQHVITYFHYKEWKADIAGNDGSLFANINTASELQQMQNRFNR